LGGQGELVLPAGFVSEFIMSGRDVFLGVFCYGRKRGKPKSGFPLPTASIPFALKEDPARGGASAPLVAAVAPPQWETFSPPLTLHILGKELFFA
jgi:hypothetical protein